MYHYSTLWWNFNKNVPKVCLYVRQCYDIVNMCMLWGQWYAYCVIGSNPNVKKFLGLTLIRHRSVRLCYFMAWWRNQMETFSALLAICAGNSPVPVEFPAQMPVTRSFDVFFDLSLNKRLSKQSWGWWFETLSCSLWRHCNGRSRFEYCTLVCINRNFDINLKYFVRIQGQWQWEYH